MSDRPRAAKETPLAIICGGGSLPLAVADAVTRRGRRVVMFPVRGFADPRDFADYPCHLIATGQFGRFRRLAVQEGCRDVVFIGVVLRPALRQIRLDWDTIRQLPRVFAMFRGGDNHLLSSLARIVEDLGFKLHGAHEVAPEILVPQGAIGRHAPGPRHEAAFQVCTIDLPRCIGCTLCHQVCPWDCITMIPTDQFLQNDNTAKQLE